MGILLLGSANLQPCSDTQGQRPSPVEVAQSADMHGDFLAKCVKGRSVYFGAPGAGSVDLKPKQVLLNDLEFQVSISILSSFRIATHSAFFRNDSAAKAVNLAALRTIVIRT